MQWVGLVVINSQGKGRREMQEGTKKKNLGRKRGKYNKPGKGERGDEDAMSRDLRESEK